MHDLFQDIDQIKLQLQVIPIEFEIDYYIEYILNIYLVLGNVRSATLLQLCEDSESVINIFISYITSKGCKYICMESDLYVMKPDTIFPQFSSKNFHYELGRFLEYPYVNDFHVNHKYTYYIKIVISDHVYDLYRMASGSKHNAKARELETKCREYFKSLCPNSYIIYGYTRKSSWKEACY